MNKPPCVTVLPWLRANLGKQCLAPLTSTDSYALRAAVQCVELYAYTSSQDAVGAFALVVGQMQPHTRRLAYHAIAHVMDWGHRAELWERAGLDLPPNLGLCAFEPANPNRYANLAAA